MVLYLKPMSLKMVLQGTLCCVPKLCNDWENQEVEQFGELFIHYSFTHCAYNAVQQVSKSKIKNQNDGCCLMKGSSSHS